MMHEHKVHHIGEVTIQRVLEQPLRNVPKSFVYPTAKREDFEGISERLSSVDLEDNQDDLVQSVHTWVVRTPRNLVLIDTGSGNHKQRPLNPLFHDQNIPFLERLREEAGVDPADVDYVFNTHLHVDHSGWNTVLDNERWVPTFPNARYVFPRKEAEYYGSPASHNDVNIPSLGVFEDSILPVIEAGLVDFIGSDGGDYLDIFKFIPTRGHSIGHMSIQLKSGSETAIFGGDVLHHPIQVLRPHLNTVFCEFPEDAAASREKILRILADDHALYCATHFAGSSAGYVTRADHGYTWSYA
ncbi:MBL fold metallo-hydrolase [Agrobacterium bohemicum]|uniref:MBL fold metallo-hydrolase n=1 Tax=Agrobacterium bohemicum TaxID=2052828 RepID=A0A135NYC5_9HYPH|nr:MBL fold metallo-hydrolase [Agrobacterium bohemicum]KXG84139.1 MBL fold metallo-hydrolase [Agrobacterium bohemicum]